MKKLDKSYFLLAISPALCEIVAIILTIRWGKLYMLMLPISSIVICAVIFCFFYWVLEAEK